MPSVRSHRGARLLVLSRHWTPLHHIEVLTKERTRALLRAGADPLASPAPGVPSPAERARAGPTPETEAQKTILRATEPWSPDNHELFPAAARARAVWVCHVGNRIANTRFGGVKQAFMDAWVGVGGGPAIMWHALARDAV